MFINVGFTRTNIYPGWLNETIDSAVVYLPHT